MGASIINRYSADYRSGINDWSYQIDFDYNPSPAHHIKFGTGYIYHRFRPEVMTSKSPKNRRQSRSRHHLPQHRQQPDLRT